MSLGITLRNVRTQQEQPLADLSDLLSLENAYDLLIQEAGALLQGQKKEVRQTVLSFTKRLIQPNVTFNRNATEKKKAETLDTVKPVFFLVQKNEMIVREGQKISELDKEKLDAFYSRKGQESLADFSVLLGIFLTIVILSLVLYFWRTRNWPKRQERSIVNSLFLSTISVFSILMVKAGIFISDAVNRAFPTLSTEAFLYAIPFAAGAMLVAVLTNRNLALVLTIFLSFLVSFLFDYDIKMSLFCFLGSVAASYHVVSCRQRSAFFKAGLFLGFFNMAVIICLSLVFKAPLSLIS
jgi:membrane-associated HD superfamily phosphohydrolase